MFSAKPLDYYKDLTIGGQISVKLQQDEACVALKIHDYGIDELTDAEKQVLYRLVGKLKDQIWP